MVHFFLYGGVFWHRHDFTICKHEMFMCNYLCSESPYFVSDLQFKTLKLLNKHNKSEIIINLGHLEFLAYGENHLPLDSVSIYHTDLNQNWLYCSKISLKSCRSQLVQIHL
jgi:hypothetical protein